MSDFEELKSNNDLKAILKSAFDADLDIGGSWGYTQALSTIVYSTETPLKQFEHMFASMRAYVEMNMTKEKKERYGSINLNELSRETMLIDGQNYHKVIYEITAIKEDVYNSFIEEYKEYYGQESFDLNLHFEKRRKATLHREVEHWFKILSV